MVITEQEKYRQALIMGLELMIKHGLGDWTVKLHGKRAVLADCNVHKKTIRYSKHFLKMATKEQLEGVTLHEIAHALAGKGHGHDAVFRQVCADLETDPKYMGRLAEGVNVPRKYLLTCPECGDTSKSNFRRDYLCRNCKNKGNSVRFTFSEATIPLIAW